MRCTGEIRDVISLGNKFLITLLTDSAEGVEECVGTQEIHINLPQKRRSLDANAYFHVLIGKIADALTISKACAKNTMLGKYGQREIDESGYITLLVRSDIPMMEREDVHTFPIGYTEIYDTEFTNYAVIRGSHTYNSKEMNYLIEGTIADAKELGIETMPPQELERMLSLWKPRKA